MSIWIVDGNIGCGKTTLLNYIEEQDFSQEKSSIVLREPLADWQPHLEQFYNNPKEYSFEFQKLILEYHISLKETINQLIGKYENIYIERSFLSCLFIFGQELVNEGNLTNEQQKQLIEMFVEKGWFPTGFIYLECSPEICYERIHKRNRNSEELISMDYLTKIHNHYKSVYNNLQSIGNAQAVPERFYPLNLSNYKFIIKTIDASNNTTIVNTIFNSLFTT